MFFYAWGDGRYVVLLLLSIVLNYVFGELIAKYHKSSKGRIVLWFALVVNLGSLVWFKYATFIADNINIVLTPLQISPVHVQPQHLPLGISFFTFQAIAYLLDVFREEATHQKSITRFALFMALFPKLAAGPIIRYGEVAGDLNQREISLDDIACGVRRFIIGLGKKVIIADTIAKTSDQIFAIPQQDLTTGIAWLGIICYTLQLYFDFSGYSDMAIGIGRMFGFKIQENFNYPYIARSLTDFWRRWHISLSTWFRDYLFIPLSYALMTDRIRKKIAEGTYRINYRFVFSIFVVFTICGLWHGAGYGFIAWGMLHGTVLGIESLWLGKKMKKWKIPIQHIYLLLVVMMSWVLFRITDLKSAIMYYKALFGFNANIGLQYHLSRYLDNELLLALLIGILGSMPLTNVVAKYSDSSIFLRKGAPVAEIIFIGLILLVSFASLAKSTFSPFMYQRF